MTLNTGIQLLAVVIHICLDQSIAHIFHLWNTLKQGSLQAAGVSATNHNGADWTAIRQWPGGLIPYNMTYSIYEPADRGVILSAMRRWEARTCVKFVPWSRKLHHRLRDKRYLNFFAGGSCFSRNGWHKNQPQLLGIGKSCLNMATVIHELGHAIGLVHPMERVDRDYYIDVRYDHIKEASKANYDTTDMKKYVYSLFGTPYDYKSIMHYGPKAYSANGGPAMVTKDPAYQDVIGNAKDISFYDALYVNRAYNCSDKCPRTLLATCKNGGYLGGPDCRCLCQDGYVGEYCEQPLPGYAHIIEWKCQKGWVYHAGRCYRYLTDMGLWYGSAKAYCKRNNSTLASIKSRPELEWLSQMTREQVATSLKRTFWIGATRSAHADPITWPDGTAIDRNLIVLEDGTSPGDNACGKFDGTMVKLGDCGADLQNGLICVKAFDETCGGRYSIGRSPRFIQSPGFPNACPEGLSCNYVLQSRDDTRIRLTFQNFFLESGCSKNYLEIKLHPDVTRPGTRYCDEELLNRTLVSDRNLAILSLHTSSHTIATGFKIKLERIQSTHGRTTTSSPFRVLDSITNMLVKFQDGRHKLEEAERKLSAIWDIFKSVTFSKVL